jgi:hypothetical protein
MTLDSNNTGQNAISRSPIKEVGIEVPVYDASTMLERFGLRTIDILKIDTEGSEVPIINSLSLRLNDIGIVMLEYHSEIDRRKIDHLLMDFKLFGSSSSMIGIGTLKYINKRLVGNC